MTEQKLNFMDEAVRLIEIVADREISGTQSIKTLIIEKQGKRFVAIQKWWRESKDKPWREGKGFHFEATEVAAAINGLEKALAVLDAQAEEDDPLSPA